MVFPKGVMTILLVFVLTASCSHRPPSPSPSPVAAKVDDVVITMESLEERLRSDQGLSEEVEGLDEPMVNQARRAVLKRMISEILIRKEAEKQGISSEELLKHITQGVSVSDEDVEISYRLAKNYKGGNPMLERRVQRLLSGSEEEIRERLREFIRRERIWVTIHNYVRPLREKADIKIYLQKP